MTIALQTVNPAQDADSQGMAIMQNFQLLEQNANANVEQMLVNQVWSTIQSLSSTTFIPVNNCVQSITSNGGIITVSANLNVVPALGLSVTLGLFIDNEIVFAVTYGIQYAFHIPLSYKSILSSGQHSISLQILVSGNGIQINGATPNAFSSFTIQQGGSTSSQLQA